MTNSPGATYRLQFHAGFTFADATAIVPYLARLGVSHVYASPIFAARPGSTHGYDVIDPTRLNPDLGTEADFNHLIAALRERGMGMIVDIVPNHMAASPDNPWWRDILANGQASPYAGYFDIAWGDEGGKLLLPVLGVPLDQAISEGRVRRDGNGLRVYGRPYPLADGTPDGPLDAVLAHQHYRLAHWRDERPNYRRFFEINDLVGMRVEDPNVFDATHSLALRLLAEQRIDGLRIDHIDGLRDPLAYLRRLRERAGDDAYIVVEKILGDHEALPADWPVDGTTGYDFLGMANGLFADGAGLRSLTHIYRRFIGTATLLDDTVYSRKRTILANRFPREMRWLSQTFARLAGIDEGVARDAILHLSSALPIYRTYVTADGISPADAAYLATAVDQAIAANAEAPIIERLREFIFSAPVSADALEFTLRWQQLTGPAMAKGLEDSTFYRYNRLISLNEVGGHADSVTPAIFHRFVRARARAWPHTMNATSTHDTKRSEDVRARLAGIAEHPGMWDIVVNDLTRTSRSHGAPTLNANTEYHLWQAAIGCWPATASLAPYQRRLTAYLHKAVREAAEHSSWRNPDHVYEAAVGALVTWLMTSPRAASTRTKINRYVRRLDRTAYKRSLAQLTVKLTLPGVPDVYQGQELWGRSFVDPDNRRPIDYRQRESILKVVARDTTALRDLIRPDGDGRAKLFLTRRLLQLRNDHPVLFASAAYQPLAPRDRSLIAFARHHRNDWVIVVVRRLFNAKPTELSIALPANAPTHWHDVLNGAMLRTRNGALPAAKALRSGLPLVAVPCRS